MTVYLFRVIVLADNAARPFHFRGYKREMQLGREHSIGVAKNVISLGSPKFLCPWRWVASTYPVPIKTS